MSKKMGRPKLPKSEARTIMLSTRVNAVESKAINRAVEASGKDKTVWIRDAIMAALER
jgi:hypothetical protein